MIKRIKIGGYKSFQDLSFELRPLTIVIGPNASGKSNLLDAIYFISRTVNQKSLKETFEGHRGLPLESFYYGDEGYEELLRRDKVEFTMGVDVELSESVVRQVEEIVKLKRGTNGLTSSVSTDSKKIITQHLLRYELTISALPKTGYLKVINERLCAIKANGQEKGRGAFLERENDRFHLRMEGQGHPIFHEIGLDHTIVSTALYEPHYPHLTAFRMELANWHTYYLEPRALMRENVPLADVENIGPQGENLAAFLNTLQYKYPKDYESFTLTLQKILPRPASLEIEHLKEGRVGFRLSEDGIQFSSRLISEGTLRLVGLLATIHPRSPATVVAFEEPENGVHPVRLKIISELLKNACGYGKQIIITTHSPIFPEYFDDQDLFICSNEDRQTKIQPFKMIYGPLFRRSDIEHALEDKILRGDLGG